MELDFVAKASRRYWPVVALFVMLGIFGAALARPSTSPNFGSTALVLVRSPDGNGADGDRYVSSQLVILQSPAIAARAAELAGVQLPESVFESAVSFQQIPGTDVVRITSVAASSSDAQLIANGYLDAYVESQSFLTAAQDNPDSVSLESSIAQAEQQLKDLDVRIEAALEPFREGASPGSGGAEARPPIEQVDPALATERDVLLEQYRELLRQRSAIEFEPKASSATQVVQRAEAPIQSTPTSSPILLVMIPIAGLLFGVSAATLLARSSKKILDSTEAAAILGAPIAVEVPKEWSLRRGSLDRLSDLPVRYAAEINGLCVQVEAQVASDRGWSVVVAGTRRVVGTTTVAAAMATRFSDLRARVLLVDLDADQQDLIQHFGSWSAEPWMPPPGHLSVIARDQFLQGAPNTFAPAPTRNDLQVAIEHWCAGFDVIVIDAGPLALSSTASMVATESDALVLTVPARRQRRAALQLIARQLESSSVELFPVIVPLLRKRKSKTTPPNLVVPEPVDGYRDVRDGEFTGWSSGAVLSPRE